MLRGMSHPSLSVALQFADSMSDMAPNYLPSRISYQGEVLKALLLSTYLMAQ